MADRPAIDRAQCGTCVDRIRLARGTFAALAPDQPAVTLVPGRHELTIVSLGGVTATVTSGEIVVSVGVHAKVGPSLPDHGVLDLEFHFAGTAWTAQTARKDERFVSMLAGLGAIYAQVGVQVGRVGLHDVEPLLPDVCGVDTAGAAILGVLARAPEGTGVDVFVVDSLWSDGGVRAVELAGLSPSLPGGAVGAGRAAVILATDPEVHLDRLLAHEIGHVLGLFHTSEPYAGQMAPRVHDQLPDTAEDDPVLLLYSSDFGTLLTPSQGVVMRSHPRIRHAPTD